MKIRGYFFGWVVFLSIAPWFALADSLETAQKSYQLKVQKLKQEHDASAKTVVERYLKYLTGIEKYYKKKGDLDRLIVLKQEVKRANEEMSIPQAAHPVFPESAKISINKYEKSYQSAKKKYAIDYITLTDRYLHHLQGIMKQCMIDDKIKDAINVKNEMDAVRANRDDLANAEVPTAGDKPEIDNVRVVQLPSPESDRAKPGKPPSNAKKHKRHFYIYFSEGVTWHEARQRCRELGGYLVCIEDRSENAFVKKISGGNPVWLGATDHEKEGEWKWVTGESFTYTDWEHDEPNSGRVKNYLTTDRRTFKWQDGGNNRAGYICEWE